MPLDKIELKSTIRRYDNMRFAFLITAHNEPYVLKKLISMLDYPDNDIYLHIDLKSRAISKNELHTESAKLILLPSRNLTWGGGVRYA